MLNIFLMAICTVLQYFMLKETRNIPLEEIARVWGREDEGK
jgi:hypothetical protein